MGHSWTTGHRPPERHFGGTRWRGSGAVVRGVGLLVCRQTLGPSILARTKYRSLPFTDTALQRQTAVTVNFLCEQLSWLPWFVCAVQICHVIAYQIIHRCYLLSTLWRHLLFAHKIISVVTLAGGVVGHGSAAHPRRLDLLCADTGRAIIIFVEGATL